MYHPVVIVHRNPDSSNEFETFGEVEVIDFDYGAVDLRDPEQFKGWAESHLEGSRDMRAKDFPEIAERILHIIRDAADNYDKHDVADKLGIQRYEYDYKARLEELRVVLRAENMSYGELAELQGLAAHIDPGDVELLEAAGVPEFPNDEG